MTHFADGARAAYFAFGFLLNFAALLAAVAGIGLLVYVWWTGPAARAGMRIRAWRFVRRVRS